jgi:hypothetical protein
MPSWFGPNSRQCAHCEKVFLSESFLAAHIYKAHAHTFNGRGNAYGPCWECGYSLNATPYIHETIGVAAPAAYATI